MRFAVWHFAEGEKLPTVVGRESTAREAEELAERTFAKEGGVRVIVYDGEAGEILLSLPAVGETA